MTVTFVLLSHNQEYDALVSLGSLYCQTNHNWRAIILNNGENPPLRKLLKKYPFDTFKYIETDSFVDTDTFNREKAFQLSETEYTVCGSIEDYFLPKTVDEILNSATDNDIIYWNGYNHHWVENAVMQTELKCRGIDWCNFAIRTDFARKVQVRHREVMADGYFIEDSLKLNPRITKIEKMLVVHT